MGFATSWSCEEDKVYEEKLGVGNTKQVLIWMSKTVTNVSTLPSIRKEFILVGEKSFPTYVTDADRFGNHYCFSKVLNKAHIELLGVETEKNEIL